MIMKLLKIYGLKLQKSNHVPHYHLRAKSLCGLRANLHEYLLQAKLWKREQNKFIWIHTANTVLLRLQEHFLSSTNPGTKGKSRGLCSTPFLLMLSSDWWEVSCLQKQQCISLLINCMGGKQMDCHASKKTLRWQQLWAWRELPKQLF